MGVLIGIDFGLKRTGLAHTDTEKIIASGLSTLEPQKVIPFLMDYQKETEIEKFVVGQPKQKNGNYSEVEKEILLFIIQLQNTFPNIPIARQDERFTSIIAFNSLIQTGAKKKTRKNKAVLDEISATLILQSFLESNSKQVS
tara:strand:- start:743 stop:1168 length:426 start_codon:yes stop_codon:yes gene_type:complete